MVLFYSRTVYLNLHCWYQHLMLMMPGSLSHFPTLCKQLILHSSWPSFSFSFFCTDFPGEVSGRSSVEQASPLLWKNRTKRRRASNPGEIYNEQGASEADIDSDSGYCSPKHNQATGATQRTAENAAAAASVSAFLQLPSFAFVLKGGLLIWYSLYCRSDKWPQKKRSHGGKFKIRKLHY